jgi:hypothetical protein
MDRGSILYSNFPLRVARKQGNQGRAGEVPDGRLRDGDGVGKRLDLAAQGNYRKPQDQRRRREEFCEKRRILTGSEVLHALESVGQIERRQVQSEKLLVQHLQRESDVDRVVVRHADKSQNAGQGIDSECTHRPGRQPVQGGYRQ